MDHTFFVIVDEAVGAATGTVNLNYHLCEGEVNLDFRHNSLTTAYDGRSNVKLQCFGEKKIAMKEKEGWRSTAYRLRVPRTAVSFDAVKADSAPVRYITVIYPVEDTSSAPGLKAKFLGGPSGENGMEIQISVNGKKRRIGYEL